MARGWGYDDYNYFPQPSRPLQAKGGIKAQSKRGTFGESWWAKRWIAVLEGFDIGSRLERGRSYARRGQVLSIDINKGLVKAKVQGSRPTPYSVEIKLNVLSTVNWQQLAAVLSRQVIFTAKLLAGEMPQDIEQAFTDAGLSLFPTQLKDLQTECSCPDWSNPCKHIAAVYYLLGEEFDRTPFLLFTLRGMNREELVRLLDQGGSKGSQKKKAQKPEADNTLSESAITPEPLPVMAADFWNGSSLPNDLFGEVRIPPTPATLIKRLGNFPFWRGQEKFLSVMEAIYSQASSRGLEVFLGEQKEKGTTSR